VLTYRPLDAAALGAILAQQLGELQEHVHTRLGERSFEIAVSPAARQVLLAQGTNERSGARELRRVLHRLLTQPLAALVADGLVAPGTVVRVDAEGDGASLALRPEPANAEADAVSPAPTVLAVDDSGHLLTRVANALAAAGMTVLTATTAQEARDHAARERPDLLLVDLVLPDGDGLSVALELLRRHPRLKVVITAGTELTADETELCERQQFTVLRKPYLPEDALSVVRSRVWRSAPAGG